MTTRHTVSGVAIRRPIGPHSNAPEGGRDDDREGGQSGAVTVDQGFDELAHHQFRADEERQHHDGQRPAGNDGDREEQRGVRAR